MSNKQRGLCELYYPAGLSRKRGDELLDWMVEAGMAELDPEDRGLILDYLATYNGQAVPRCESKKRRPRR